MRGTALIALLLLLLAQTAQADGTSDLLVRTAESAYAIIVPLPNQLQNTGAGLAATASGVVLGAAQGAVPSRTGYTAAIGSGPESLRGLACGEVKAAMEFDKKPIEPRLVLLLGPGDDPQRCPQQLLQWNTAQVQGDWQRGWNGTSTFGSTVHRVTIGPYGNGLHIPVHWTAKQGQIVVGDWNGYVVNVL